MSSKRKRSKSPTTTSSVSIKVRKPFVRDSQLPGWDMKASMAPPHASPLGGGACLNRGALACVFAPPLMSLGQRTAESTELFLKQLSDVYKSKGQRVGKVMALKDALLEVHESKPFRLLDPRFEYGIYSDGSVWKVTLDKQKLARSIVASSDDAKNKENLSDHGNCARDAAAELDKCGAVSVASILKKTLEHHEGGDTNETCDAKIDPQDHKADNAALFNACDISSKSAYQIILPRAEMSLETFFLKPNMDAWRAEDPKTFLQAKLSILAQLVRLTCALGAFHAQGLAYLDAKTSNILLFKEAADAQLTSKKLPQKTLAKACECKDLRDALDILHKYQRFPYLRLTDFGTARSRFALLHSAEPAANTVLHAPYGPYPLLANMYFASPAHVAPEFRDLFCHQRHLYQKANVSNFLLFKGPSTFSDGVAADEKLLDELWDSFAENKWRMTLANSTTKPIYTFDTTADDLKFVQNFCSVDEPQCKTFKCSSERMRRWSMARATDLYSMGLVFCTAFYVLFDAKFVQSEASLKNLHAPLELQLFKCASDNDVALPLDKAIEKLQHGTFLRPMPFCFINDAGLEPSVTRYFESLVSALLDFQLGSPEALAAKCQALSQVLDSLTL